MEYFSSIIGQDRAVSLLKKSIEHDSISHAYLFLGPAGVGKMITALAFARTIIGHADKDAGLFFKENMHPDLLVVERLEKKTLIGKEQISKDLEPWLGLKPYRASRRVVIIRDSHLMSTEAANALLKTLEEPPEYAVIILVSDDNNLLETIISRCQMLRFFPIADKEIEKFLLQRGIEPERARHVAQLGQGSMSAAQRFAEEQEYEQIWDLSKNIILGLASGQIVEVYNCAEKMEAHPELISNMLISILRDINIYQQTGNKEFLAAPVSMSINEMLKQKNSHAIMEALNRIIALKGNYKKNVNSLIINTNISYQIWKALN